MVPEDLYMFGGEICNNDHAKCVDFGEGLRGNRNRDHRPERF